MNFRQYTVLGKKGEGTFSTVLKAQHHIHGHYVAIKVMKNTFESLDQVERLREIQALKRLSGHSNIIQLLEVLYDTSSGQLALVFELMAMNLYEYISSRSRRLPDFKIKNYMYQLLKSIDYTHRKSIFHRDIKPENVLILGNTLKLADYGSCRGRHTSAPFTEYISTRWYRAPECLLTDGYYGSKMDIWGCGCVFYEMITFNPLFPGENELDQVRKIHSVIGTPRKKVLERFKRKYQTNSNISFDFPYRKGRGIARILPSSLKQKVEIVDLLEKLLIYDPDERITAQEAVMHPYFRDLREQDDIARSRPGGVGGATSLPDIARSGGVGRRRQPAAAAGVTHHGGPTGPAAAARSRSFLEKERRMSLHGTQTKAQPQPPRSIQPRKDGVGAAVAVANSMRGSGRIQVPYDPAGANAGASGSSGSGSSFPKRRTNPYAEPRPPEPTRPSGRKRQLDGARKVVQGHARAAHAALVAVRRRPEDIESHNRSFPGVSGRGQYRKRQEERVMPHRTGQAAQRHARAAADRQFANVTLPADAYVRSRHGDSPDSGEQRFPRKSSSAGRESIDGSEPTGTGAGSENEPPAPQQGLKNECPRLPSVFKTNIAFSPRNPQVAHRNGRGRKRRRKPGRKMTVRQRIELAKRNRRNPAYGSVVAGGGFKRVVGRHPKKKRSRQYRGVRRTNQRRMTYRS